MRMQSQKLNVINLQESWLLSSDEWIHRIWHIHTRGCCAVLNQLLCPTLCNPMGCSPPDSSVHGDSPGKSTGVGCHALLQEVFPTQGSNPGLLPCRWILYHLSHQGSLYKGRSLSDSRNEVLIQVPHKWIWNTHAWWKKPDAEDCILYILFTWNVHKRHISRDRQ